MKGKYTVFNDLNGVRYNLFRLIALSLTITGLVAAFSVHKVFLSNEKAKANAYLLHKGNRVPLEHVEDPRRNLEILLEGHLDNFHNYMFSLEPDLRMIKRQIEGWAFYMVDDSGKRFYKRLVANDFYKDVVTRGYRYEYEMDSVHIDYGNYPFPFRLYAKVSIEKGSNMYYRRLVTSGVMKETGITPKNLNGVLIQKFRVDNNEEINP